MFAQIAFELREPCVALLDQVFQVADNLLEDRSSAFGGLQRLQIIRVAVAGLFQVPLEAGDGLRVSGKPGIEVETAGRKLRLKIARDTGDLNLELVVALEELLVRFGIA